MTTTEAALTEPQCERDHNRWLEEIGLWKRDHTRALAMLEETADFIHRHDLELSEHLRDIEAHRASHALGEPPSDEVRRRHLEVRERHNSFQGRHRGLMEAVLQLRVALHKAAHGQVFSPEN